MATATKKRSPKQLANRIEQLKDREATLTEQLGIVRNERKHLEAELKESRAAAKAGKP